MVQLTPMTLRRAIAEGRPAKARESSKDLIYDPKYVPAFLPPSRDVPAAQRAPPLVRDPPSTGSQRRTSSTPSAVAGPSAPPLRMEVAVPDFPSSMTRADYNSPPPHATTSSPHTPSIPSSPPYFAPLSPGNFSPPYQGHTGATPPYLSPGGSPVQSSTRRTSTAPVAPFGMPPASQHSAASHTSSSQQSYHPGTPHYAVSPPPSHSSHSQTIQHALATSPRHTPPPPSELPIATGPSHSPLHLLPFTILHSMTLPPPALRQDPPHHHLSNQGDPLALQLGRLTATTMTDKNGEVCRLHLLLHAAPRPPDDPFLAMLTHPPLLYLLLFLPDVPVRYIYKKIKRKETKYCIYCMDVSFVCVLSVLL